jgi:AGZA family xanthine/uracil permease-like MFS transporter
VIPLTYSIAHGVGYGFITYVTIKLLRGKWGELGWVMYLVAAAFVAQFVWVG